MQHQEGSFSGVNETNLYYQSWHPSGKPQAVVAIVHGFGEHSSRYRHVASELVRRNMVVYGFDLRGHGRSSGQRGHIDSFAEFRKDVEKKKKMIFQKEPNRSLFLLGHSMGGLIVLNYALNYPDGLSGVVASGPHLADPPVSPVLVKIGQVLSSVWPTFSINAGLDTQALSRDMREVQAYENDPLVHGKATPRLSTELATAVEWTQDHAAEFQPPLLIIHGDADTLTDPTASLRFYENVKSPEKTYISYEGGYHESFNDIHRERVLTEVGQWLEYQTELAAKHTESEE